MLSANRRKTGGKPAENRWKTGGKPSENDRKTVEEMSEYRYSRDTSHMMAPLGTLPESRQQTGGELPESCQKA